MIRTIVTPMISPLAFLTFFNCLGAGVRYSGLSQKGRKAEVPQEIPETTLSDDFIRCEDAHPIYFGVGVGLGGKVTADDLVFLETHLR